MERSNRNSLAPIYFLSTIGDQCDSMLLVGAIIYATALGASEIEIGWIGGAYGIAYFFMPAILGRLGDKFSRKNSLIIATTSFVFIPIYFLIFAKTPLLLFFGRLIVGIFYSFFWTAVEAYISEKSGNNEQAHQKGIANFCISWGIGYWLGPFIAAWLSDSMMSMIFYFTFIVYIVGWIIVIFFIPNIKPIKSKDQKISNTIPVISDPLILEKQKNNEPKQMAHSRMLIFLLISLVFYSCIARLILSYFPFYAVSSDGPLKWTGKTLGQVLFVFGLGRMTFFIIGRFWKTSYNQIAIAYVIIGIFLFLLNCLNSIIILEITFYFLGFAIGFVYLSSLNLTLHHEKEKKGGMAGLFESAIGMGSILSPVIAGWLGSISLKLPFIVFSIIPLLIFVCYIIFFRKPT